MTASAILSDIQMSSRLVLSTTYPQGCKAVRPAICPESRLSRELGAPLYSVQLGTRKTKPRLLYPLVLSELQRAAPSRLRPRQVTCLVPWRRGWPRRTSHKKVMPILFGERNCRQEAAERDNKASLGNPFKLT